MRIFIITMDDPIQTRHFIKHILDKKKDMIIGLAMSKGNRFSIRSKPKYRHLISMLLIMGIPSFIKTSFTSIFDMIQKKASIFGITKNPSILSYANSLQIPTWEINSPNNKELLKELTLLKPDIIINQSNHILKKELLNIPSIGTINRHNALLPKNRGLLSPFWVLYKQEKETGVSIHFVEEGIDTGEIIIQKKYSIKPKDNFNSLVKKNYLIAKNAIIEAIDILEKKDFITIPNNDKLASYNSSPTLREAWGYRKKKIMKLFNSNSEIKS